jgi:C1A family cysteine protease
MNRNSFLQFAVAFATFTVVTVNAGPTSITDAAPDDTLVQAEDYVREFERFIERFDKEYASPEERAKHFQAFKENYDFIIEHNTKGHSYHVGVTPFSDLTQEEFAKFYTNKMIAHPEHNVANSSGFPILGVYEAQDLEVPSSVDWQSAGAVTAVKNQGQCGSCWTFATTGALEGAWKIASNQLLSLSEQQVLDCLPVINGGTSGCDGGSVQYALDYLTKHKTGVCLESSYSYTARYSPTCKSCSVAIPNGGVQGFFAVQRGNSQALMEAVAKQPVAVSVYGKARAFQLYTSGVLTQVCNGMVDHAVLVVGYGRDGGHDYWKVKNSWGSSWGEGGYIRLIRGATSAYGECDILYDPVYAKVDPAHALWYYNIRWGLWFMLAVVLASVLCSLCCLIQKCCCRRSNVSRTPFLNTSGTTRTAVVGGTVVAPAQQAVRTTGAVQPSAQQALAGAPHPASVAATAVVTGNSRNSRLLQPRA